MEGVPFPALMTSHPRPCRSGEAAFGGTSQVTTSSWALAVRSGPWGMDGGQRSSTRRGQGGGCRLVQARLLDARSQWCCTRGGGWRSPCQGHSRQACTGHAHPRAHRHLRRSAAYWAGTGFGADMPRGTCTSAAGERPGSLLGWWGLAEPAPLSVHGRHRAPLEGAEDRLHSLKASPLPKLLTTASLWEEVCLGQRKGQSRTRGRGPGTSHIAPLSWNLAPACHVLVAAVSLIFSYLSCLWASHLLKPSSFLRESVFYSKQEKIKKISWPIFYLSDPGVFCKLSCCMPSLFLSTPTPLARVQPPA